MRLNRSGRIDLGGIDFRPAQPRRVVRAADKSGAAHIGNLRDGHFGRQAVCHLHQRTLGVAVQKQVALGVQHNGAAHFVRPVVVVGNAAQRAFNAAQNQRHIRKSFAAALAVHNGGAVGALAAHVAWGVGVVRSNFAVRRVAVDHGVHIARRHAPKQVGFAKRLEGLGTGPVGLRNDAHPKTLRLEHATHHRHTEAGVVHIGVAGDQNHVAAVPTQLVHFGAAHGQKFGRAKARRPVLSVAGQGFGRTRKVRDVNQCIHELGTKCMGLGANPMHTASSDLG